MASYKSSAAVQAAIREKNRQDRKLDRGKFSSALYRFSDLSSSGLKISWT